MRSFLLAGVVLLTLGAGSSQAQVIVPIGGGGGWGGGGWGGGGWGGGGWGGGGWGWGGGNPWNFPNFRPLPPIPSGLPAAFSGGGAIAPGGGGAFSSGPLIFPGWVAPDMARKRDAIYPAVTLPSKDIIAARLEGGSDDSRGRLTLNVPTEDAKVFIEGATSVQTGKRRFYVTPPLSGDGPFVLNIVVEWNDDAGPQRRTQAVRVAPGEGRNVTIN